ncbi:MAG TPA: methyltransferase domain-containing protein [Candidatus Dormibacteraeota bacterium]|nr:methyltransferase domain-containing protein [Candidatus Dormibacteraeota bacterium]
MHIETTDRWKDYPQQTEFAQGTLDPNSSLAILVGAVGERKRVLDVGCATGYLAKVLQSRQCDTVGIDINPKAAEEARKYCSRVVVTDLDNASIAEAVGDDTFDIIVFADVLEHLRNPLRVLDEARSLLREGGFALISLPNIAHGAVRLALLQGNFDYQELGLLDDSHLRFFTRRSAEELFLEAGYHLEEVGRTVLPLFSESDLVPDVRESDFSAEAVEAVRRDPDCDTLQFILRAYPLNNEARFRNLAKRFLATNTELANTRTRSERERELLAQASARLEQHEAELAQTRQFLASANAEMLRAQADYQALAADAREIEGLRLRVQDAEALQASAASATERAHGFEIDLVRAQERLAIQTARAAELEARVIDLTHSLGVFQQEQHRLEAESEAKDDRARDLLEAIARLEDAAQHPAENAVAQQRIPELLATVESLRVEIAESEKLFKLQDAEVAAARMQTKDAEQELATLQQKVAVLEQDLTRSGAMLSAAYAERGVLHAKLGEAERELFDRDARVQGLERDAESLRAAQAESRKTIEDLYAQWEGLEAAAAEYRAQIETLQRDVEHARGASSDRERRITSLDANIQRLELRATADKESIEQLHAAIGQFESVTRELEFTKSALTAERARLQSDVQAAESRCNILESRAIELESVLLENTESLASRLRAESAQLATLIDLIQSGSFWSLKRFFGRVGRIFGRRVS